MAFKHQKCVDLSLSILMSALMTLIRKNHLALRVSQSVLECPRVPKVPEHPEHSGTLPKIGDTKYAK
jgi:hypothetical protein